MRPSACASNFDPSLKLCFLLKVSRCGIHDSFSTFAHWICEQRAGISKAPGHLAIQFQLVSAPSPQPVHSRAIGAVVAQNNISVYNSNRCTKSVKSAENLSVSTLPRLSPHPHCLLPELQPKLWRQTYPFKASFDSERISKSQLLQM